MSNYGATPPPGAYQNAAQQSYNGQQQQQGHQSGTSSHGQSSHGHKSGGVFGQMMTFGQQAVTTSKPMLDKMGKTISSKLGNKPAPGPPQHLQSYQNYQQHNASQTQSQTYQQQQNQPYTSPQPQQQPWQQLQQTPPATNTYNAGQPSPYQQQSSYSTPASAHTNQTNYFPQQNVPPPSQSPNPPPPPPAPPNSQAPNMPQQASHAPSFHTPSFGLEQQGQQGQPIGGQFSGQYQQEQNSQYGGQQTGVISGATAPDYGHSQPPSYQHHTDTPNVASASPGLATAAQAGQQSQWGYPPEKTGLHNAVQQQYQSPPNVGFQQSDQQQQLPQQQQQHWLPMSPTSPQGQVPSPAPYPAVSPPPLQQQMNLPPAQPPTPASQAPPPSSSPAEFIAELPADMGNMKLSESPKAAAPLTAQYKAYSPSPQNASSPTKGFSVPRRAMSTSSIPFADPWRWVDPTTEQPTREFFAIADLLFDTLDRKFEPRNTGLLEAPKVLASWIDTTDDARQLFTYNNYLAFAHMWSTGNIPHIMVPIMPKLAPIWNFDKSAHADAVKVSLDSLMERTSHTAYMPALNRAGWYKHFFTDVTHDPALIDKLIPALCADTYKPGVLYHPDLNKRDRSEVPAHQVRAAEVKNYAVKRACEDARNAMMLDPSANAPRLSGSQPGVNASNGSGLAPGSPEDMAVRMHRLQSERQQNDMGVKTVIGSGITFGGGGHSGGGYGSPV